jgi:hypothetical protein
MTMAAEDEKETEKSAKSPRDWDTVYREMLDSFALLAKHAFDLGDTKRLLQVLYFYLANDTLPPKWARDELCDFYDAEGLDVQSWDDVFGEPSGKKTKRQRKEEIAYWEGKRLHRRYGYKIADDSDLFPELGKVLGLSAGMAKEYYYGHKQRLAKRRKELKLHESALKNSQRKTKADFLLIGKAKQADRLNEAIEDLHNEIKARISGKTPEQVADDLLLAGKAFSIDMVKRTSEKSAPKTRINKPAGGGRQSS